MRTNLSSRIIEAYRAKDMDKLTLAADDCKTLIRKLSSFHKSYQKRWFKENKPHGFDVQDIRIGGLMIRVRSCVERLQELYDGKIDKIEELEEKQLDFFGNGEIFESRHNCFYWWSHIVTANNV